MSTTDEQIEPTFCSRTFESEIVEGDGRTLIARVVPFDVEAVVSDPPHFTPYREAFAPGAFDRQIRAPDRVKVWLNFEHEQGLRGLVGHGTELQDRGDALYGTFRIVQGVDGDKALQLVEDGLLTGVSMEFAPHRSQRIGGVVRRLRASLDKVSLCRFPAYSEAQVLGLREEPDDLDDDGDRVDEPDDEEQSTFAERLRAEHVAPVPLDETLAGRLAALRMERLARVGTTSAPWDGSPQRFDDEQYLRSCVIVRSGEGSPKERGSLAVLEPDGVLNVNALGHAAALLSRGAVRGVTNAQKAAAARKLIRYFAQAKIAPPASLYSIGRSA